MTPAGTLVKFYKCPCDSCRCLILLSASASDLDNSKRPNDPEVKSDQKIGDKVLVEALMRSGLTGLTDWLNRQNRFALIKMPFSILQLITSTTQGSVFVH